MRPIDIAVEETLAFFVRFLPPPPIRILEVGCGHGDLALQLIAAGFQVTPLDIDAESVRRARDQGLSVVEGDFLQYEDDPYDALLFGRSFHHIHPLHAAVERSWALLRPGGLLICDEFARERVDRHMAIWLFNLEALLHATEVLSPEHHHHDPSLTDPLERLQARYTSHGEHPLHTGVQMLTEIERRFELVHSENGPYLYHYFAERLEESRRGCHVAEQLLKIERDEISDGSLIALGLQFVGRRSVQERRRD